jgi:hypothetical protein
MNDICINLKWGIYLGFIAISYRVFVKLGSSGFITSIVNKQTVFKTSLMYLLIVSLECWNLSRTCLFKISNAIIYRNIAKFSITRILLEGFNLYYIFKSLRRLNKVVVSILNMWTQRFQCPLKTLVNYFIIVLYET